MARMKMTKMIMMTKQTKMTKIMIKCIFGHNKINGIFIKIMCR